MFIMLNWLKLQWFHLIALSIRKASQFLLVGPSYPLIYWDASVTRGQTSILSFWTCQNTEIISLCCSTQYHAEKFAQWTWIIQHMFDVPWYIQTSLDPAILIISTFPNYWLVTGDRNRDLVPYDKGSASPVGQWVSCGG